ncbi:VCBS domain-containing protein [Vibrio atlanticus]|nr:VCBS domain-containing protein [Vibrio atlanticus]
MANKKNVEANKKNTEIKNKKSNKLEQKKPTQKKKRRLHSHLKVNIPLFQSLMMILPSLAKHAAAESIDNSSDAADQVTANNVTEKDVTDDHSKADSSAVALQEAQTSDSDINSTLSASHAAHGSSSHLVPSHHLSTLSHPQVHYIPSVSMPTISSGSNGQPTHSNAPTTPALPVSFMPEVIKGTYGELHVDANGQYTFVLNPNTPQYILLNQHQPGTDHFALHLSNGSSIIVQIPVTGKQDTPNISGDLTGVVTEDHNIDSQGLLHANGKIDVIDPDQNQSSVTPEVISGKYGSLTIDADGHWQYQVDNSLSNVQALTAATSLHESFTIHTKDGTPQTIDMTIGGNDDNAVITGVDAGVVTEDLTTQVQGQLSVTDSDLGEDHFQASQVTSNFGTLSITKDGAWTYNLDNNNPVVQKLGQGSTATDIVTVHSADGTAHQVMVTINGTNDHAVITSSTANSPSSFFAIGTSNGSSHVTEDKDLTVSGQLNITDIDSKEAHFSNSDLKGTLGTLHLKDNGDWSYDLDNNKPQVQALGKGSSTTDIITVHSADGTPHQITITVNGTNDKAVISGTSAGVVTEESQLQTSGILTVTDVDTGEAHFATSSTGSTDIAGSFGTLHLTDTGSWTYDLDNTNPTVQALGKGATATDTITVQSADGTPHQVTITVNGTNGKAIIGGTNSGAVTEESQLQTSGTLAVTDVDTGEAHFSNTDIVGSFGTLHLTDTGSWTYDLDNTNPTVQALGANKTATDTITVHSADGTPHQVTITVNGTNDAAVIGGTSAAAVTEETQLQTTGTLTITDTDGGEAHFANTDIQGTLGTLHLTDNGAWTYDLDNTNPAVQALGNGATTTDVITVNSADGTPHQITITVNGTNDNAVVGGVDTASVTEKAAGDNMSPDHAQPGMATLRVSTLNANGHLSVVDPDSGQSGFADNNVGYNYHGTYGDLILNPNGDWNYYADAGSLSHIGARPTTRGSAIDKLGEGETLTDTITVHTKDGTPHNIVITINGSNDRPYCSSEVQLNAGTEDTRQTITAAALLQHSIDVDKNDSGLLTVVNLHPDHGSILDNQDGTYTFTPEKDYNGKVHFSYDVKDAHGGVTHTGATTSLSAVADKAVITGTDTGTIVEDHNVGPSSLQPVAASGLLSVTDPDAGQDHFQVNLLLGEQAIHDPFGGFLRITPSGAWGYEVANSRLQSLAEGEVEKVVYRVYSADHTAHDITITVTGTNDKPTITATTLAHGTEDTHYQMQASQFGFSDIDTGDTLHSIAITGLPSATQGKFVLDGHDVTAGQHIPTADISKLQFVPAQDFNGDVQFKYTVNDGHTDSAEATNTLHIDAVGDKAVISGVDTGDVHEGHTFTAPDGSMTGGYVDDRSPDHMHGNIGKLWNDEIHTDGHLSIVDADAGESYAQTGVYYGSHGRVILQTNGDWSYFASIGQDVTGRAIDHLGKGESLTDTVTVKSADGTTHDIIITIHGDNDRPYCSGEVQLNSGKEDLAQTITASELLANTVDVDTNDAGQLTIANLHADHGTLVDNKDGTFTFTPDHDFNGKVHFTYDVKDAHGGVTHTGASATLLPSNDAATLQPTLASNFVTEDHLKSGTNTNELWSGWKNLDIQDIDSQPEAKVTQIEVNGVKHTVPANFAMNLAGTHGTFNFTHSTDGHDKWSYSADNSHAEVQSLSHGDSLTDTITLITADGTRIPLTAKILGTDDHVIIDTPDALTAALGTAVEDKVTSISGTLLAHDSDSKDSVTFTAGNSVGAYGTLHVDSNGQWHYDLDHSKANALQQGETKAEGFDITAISTDGSTATKHIEVLVQGNDDGAIISGQDSGQVTEDKHLQTSGNLTVTDPDSGEGHFTATSGSTQLGTYTIDASGHWTYSLDPRVQSLHQGETTPDVFTVHSADGTAHVIKVTITGTQDAPIITGQSTGAVYEDSQTSVSGTLNADDKDYGQSGFWAQSHIASTHNFGDLSIDRNGHWTFHLDPTNTAVNALGEHDTLLETVTVNTIDGTSKEIQITIHGTNDGAIISGADTGSVTEDQFTGMQWLITKGQLTISDADTGEDKFDSMVHAQNNAGIGYDTKLGGHVLLSEDGSWQYNMDNFSPAVQKLAEGETAIDTVTIHSVDGTPHEIQITITGTNDAPILGVNQTSSTTGTLTEADVDVNDTHTFSIVSSTGQFGSLSVDPNTGDYIYTPNTSITGMSYNSATNSYHGVDVFEVKVSDGHTEDSKFITFDASGHVTMSPTGGLVISTAVPQQPTVTTTLPTLLMVTNVAPTNSVTLNLASTSDSGSSNTDNLTNDTTPTITGHTDIPFSKVTIYDGSTPVGHEVSDASGQYSVAVSSLSEGDHNLSAKALAPSSVLPATSSLLSVHIDTQVHVGIQTDPITADNVINAQESSSSIDITGSVSGDFNAGDIVTLDVNGTQHTGVVDAKGHYSIAVPGSELIADADQKIEASVAVTDSAGNSAHATADVTYQVDTQVSVPTITFENAGADNLYSKAEIARGQANTITATVTPPGDAKIGEHLVVNGQDHVLDAHTLQHGIQIEVHPGSNVQATMTDEHGNTAGSQGFAASAIPEPIIVRPPSGSHQVSGTLGVPPLLPSLTPVPTAQSGWRIHLPNGQYVTSHHGQYGTLTIDPQTGHLHYQEQAQVHTGPHGSASGIGQHEDKFEVALQGTNQDEVVAHVNIQILSHGPGNSGKLTVGTEVVDMTITPVVHTSHPAPPPPPPVQHDEPDMASQADFTVTLSDDSNLDLTQQTHQEPEQKTSHHGAAAYLDALGIKPDATSTTVHDQPADMDIVLAQVDQQDATTHDQAHLDMSDALEHHDANINHNQDDEHHHHNDVDGLPDIDPNS